MEWADVGSGGQGVGRGVGIGPWSGRLGSALTRPGPLTHPPTRKEVSALSVCTGLVCGLLGSCGAAWSVW